MPMYFCIIVQLLALIFIFPTISRAESISIPIRTIGQPAADLQRGSQTLEPGTAAQLEKNGTDLSLIEPKDNNFWSHHFQYSL